MNSGFGYSSLIGRTQKGFPLPIEGCKLYRDNPEAMEGSSFFVCAMLTPGERYYRYANRLADSCEAYRLPYRIYEVPHVHTSINLRGTLDLAYTKANLIAANMQAYPNKNILYLDVDVLFVDYPQRIHEISASEVDLALYNWLNDWHNEAYVPVIDTLGGKRIVTRCYIYSHHIDLYCPDQLICSGGVQFYRNAPHVMELLKAWQNVVARSPLSADDECLDYAYNNRDMALDYLRPAWLDKSYLRMPWWPHVKPVILHPGMPSAADNRSPLPPIDNRTRFNPAACRRKRSDLHFPRDYYIDTEKKLLVKIANAGIADIRAIQQEFWVYPEEM